VNRAAARRALLAASLMLCLAAPCAWLGAAQTPATEQEVKAAFLYHFTRFVDWPGQAPQGRGEFVVAVLGADQFYAVADRVLSGKSAQDLPVSVRRVTGPGEAVRARILFVGAGEASRLPEILGAVEGSGVLTVGDFAGFAEEGGIIGFRTVDNRVRFDVNVEQARRSGLKIGSEVLKLARVVRTRSER
jgi:hypothetical protein